ncbi:ribokinase [Paraoerskovia sediminicola]|uniref:Ribokinase n=1 Tax=Paraoerskovia sediminicola TaxID=1138587 RepID=A0ABM8G1J2_9CELL|nr:carbohydrate kinase [Paraoerskovia sediminicola]BDZ41885.1 ribokinase [Paraoerskovia sediminicola]
MRAARPEGPRVVVVGEALVDVVHRADGSVEELPGGSPANVAITLGRLDRAPVLVTCLGEDSRGARVRGWLEASDVDVRVSPIDRTATALARLDASGAATYEFDLGWELVPDAVPAGDVLHVGSIGALLEPGGAAVRDAVRRAAETGHGLVTYDPNARPSITRDRDGARAKVEQIVADADVVKVSDEDLAWFYPDVDHFESAAAWSTAGPALVVVTAGGEGSVAFRDGARIAQVPVPRVEVVDTVGAGDTYMGGLIDGLLSLGLDSGAAVAAASSAQIESVCAHAARAAAVTVSRPGADPPRRDELGRPQG